MTVTMPQAYELLDMIEMILGSKPPLSESKEAWDLAKAPDGTYVTWLCNSEGDKRGAVVTNINATLFLGGKLVMMPEAGLDDSARRLEVEDTIVEAVEEIVNMLRSVLNKQVGNEHLSPLPTEPFGKIDAEGSEGWVLGPGGRLDLVGECSFGPLNLSLVFP